MHLYGLSPSAPGFARLISNAEFTVANPFNLACLVGGKPKVEPTVVELWDPAAGKNRLGGAHDGRSCSSLDVPRSDRDENAGAAEPLPKNAESTSLSIVGVPGIELLGVVKGEFAE